MAKQSVSKLAAMKRAASKLKRLEEPHEREDNNETASQEAEEESGEI